jgi:hypothetical protein
MLDWSVGLEPAHLVRPLDCKAIDSDGSKCFYSWSSAKCGPALSFGLEPALDIAELTNGLSPFDRDRQPLINSLGVDFTEAWSARKR